MTANNSRICGVLLSAFTVCILSFPAQAKYSGGTGEPNDPYQIATAEDLMLLGDSPEDYGKHFILTADIDLDPNLPGRKVFDKAVIAPATPTNANPYVEGTPFTGVCDGKGHVISHLTIKGQSFVGLFGYMRAKVMDLGVVDVNITGSGDCIGGLVGRKGDRGILIQCYSTGMVTGLGDHVGGLVGYNEGEVTRCYSTSAVSGSGSFMAGVGGLVGTSDGGSLTECYSAGAVSGNDAVGGLVGYYHSILPRREPVPTDCFWDTQTSGQATSDAGTGKTTAEMQTASTFLQAGWYVCGVPSPWTIDERNDYPRLWWEHAHGQAIEAMNPLDVLAGTGTENDPYLIYTAEEFQMVGLMVCDWDKHFTLMADIDLSGLDGKEGRSGFNVIGTGPVPFAGVFEGDGHRVSHLTIAGVHYLGLFGRLESSAKVKNLGVVDVNITGSGFYMGGLVGENDGTVTQCYSTGTVNGSGNVGGLVGRNHNTVTQSYSAAGVSGTVWGVGGLVGFNFRGNVTHCYSTGAVSGYYVGGLLGSGDANDVIASFWDIETSGQAASAGGTGKATAEMQTARTFLNAGWDFVGETVNGTEEIWWILEGKDYPRLWWETQ